jgi:glutathione reductase (NADPH)
MDVYDLIVIGTGTAAQTAAGRVRRAGRSVAVIDHRPFGGTCALRGCDPKKILVSGAEAVDFARRMHKRGVAGALHIDWKELIALKRTLTDPIPSELEERFAKPGITAYHGLARFTGPDRVAVDSRVLHGGHILIASGARPVPLRFPGAEHLVTSDACRCSAQCEKLTDHGRDRSSRRRGDRTKRREFITLLGGRRQPGRSPCTRSNPIVRAASVS